MVIRRVLNMHVVRLGIILYMTLILYHAMDSFMKIIYFGFVLHTLIEILVIVIKKKPLLTIEENTLNYFPIWGKTRTYPLRDCKIYIPKNWWFGPICITYKSSDTHKSKDTYLPYVSAKDRERLRILKARYSISTGFEG